MGPLKAQNTRQPYEKGKNDNLEINTVKTNKTKKAGVPWFKAVLDRQISGVMSHCERGFKACLLKVSLTKLAWNKRKGQSWPTSINPPIPILS